MRWRGILMAAAMVAFSGCDPIDDCSPGQFEVFRSPRKYMVFFGSGSPALSEKARGTVGLAIESAGRPGTTTIVLVGHSDAAGPADSNLHLSQRRAEAVRDALVAGGIASSRISITARGASQPLVQTRSPDENNRRVEITVQIPASEQAVGYLSCRDGFRRVPSTMDKR